MSALLIEHTGEARAASKRSRRARRGYTVVEVLSAMTLFAIGAAGVIGMQRVTIQGGADARNFDVATNIAREWQHRLQRDSLLWTQPNSVVTTSNLSDTRWLSQGLGAADTWVTPAVGPNGDGEAGFSHAFDLLGRDVAEDDPERIFCVQYKMGWIAPPGANAGSPAITAIARAEIRVFWARLEFGPPVCAAGPIANQHHVVTLTTALRENPLQ